MMSSFGSLSSHPRNIEGLLRRNRRAIARATVETIGHPRPDIAFDKPNLISQCVDEYPDSRATATPAHLCDDCRLACRAMVYRMGSYVVGPRGGGLGRSPALGKSNRRCDWGPAAIPIEFGFECRCEVEQLFVAAHTPR